MNDGSLFIQGKGVQPDIYVPITIETVTSKEDVVLKYGEDIILLPLGAGMRPTSPPRLETDKNAAEGKLVGGTKFLEDRSREGYDPASITIPGKYTYTISLSQSEDLIWSYGWCNTLDSFEQSWEHIHLKFYLEDKEVSSEKMFQFDFEPTSSTKCRYYYNNLSDWKTGESHLNTKVEIDETLNNGSEELPPGEWVFEYKVYLKP
jgi:hypothetical protein